jgi:hypothetical protein
MNNNVILESWGGIDSEPTDVIRISDNERNSIIVSAIKVDGSWVVLSRYGEDIWHLNGFTSNVSEHARLINFARIPAPFRAVMKAVLYRYLRHGRAGQRRPKGPTLSKFFANSRIFFKHLQTFNIERLREVSPVVCADYIAACRAHRQTHRHHGKPLSQCALSDRLQLVETLYELSQFTHDPIPQHPWPDSSAMALAGLTGSAAHRNRGCTTPLIPDDIFCILFNKANDLVQRGKELLDLRDTLKVIANKHKHHTTNTISIAKTRYLKKIGWIGGYREFHKSLLELRTACYIVLASTSGCRNHELANLQIGAHHRSVDDDGTNYHWMRSRSEKTDVGIHDWMIPEAAVRALRLMERWAEPYQAMIATEIAQLQRINRYDPIIERLREHLHSLFLGEKDNKVRTLSVIAWGRHLTYFAKNSGLDWPLASHQFRRKFANYVAHSQFGDLRYLCEHFAHWTLDMSLGYAIDTSWGQHLDLDLFDDVKVELEGIKHDVVSSWLEEKSLAGGYGQSLKYWQLIPTNITTFNSQAAMIASIAATSHIRSTGHGWCTADDNRCIGNTLEKTRCSDCDNAVIGRGHARFYQALYDNLRALLKIKSIGESGRQRVLHDLSRCQNVLMQLGFEPEVPEI